MCTLAVMHILARMQQKLFLIVASFRFWKPGVYLGFEFISPLVRKASESLLQSSVIERTFKHGSLTQTLVSWTCVYESTIQVLCLTPCVCV